MRRLMTLIAVVVMIAGLVPGHARAATALDSHSFSRQVALAYRIVAAQRSMIEVTTSIDDSDVAALVESIWLIDENRELVFALTSFGREYRTDVFVETPAGVHMDRREAVTQGPGGWSSDVPVEPGEHTLVVAMGTEGALARGEIRLAVRGTATVMAKTVGTATVATGRAFSGGINAVAGHSFARAGAVAAASKSVRTAGATFIDFRHFGTGDPYAGEHAPSALMRYRDPSGSEHSGASSYRVAGGGSGAYRFAIDAAPRGVLLEDTILVVADV